MPIEDFSQLADELVTCYAQGVLEKARQTARNHVRIGDQNSRFIQSISSISNQMQRYQEPESLDAALDAIDLAKIYDGVDKREKDAANGSSKDALGYEDFIVLETLGYFKNDFFRWVNSPKCSKCGQDGSNMEFRRSEGPPTPNPDEISRVEVHHCKTCNEDATFPRYNSPVKLLETREGRCGEWVNCFMLILLAVLGSTANIRYVWNHEDHVWCEYYSEKQKRWIHLDPCENVFDEPSLYCENWGKKMSWVLAVSDVNIADVSDKYITKEDKKIAKLSVANEKEVLEYIHWAQEKLLVRYWDQKIDPFLLSTHDKLAKLYVEIVKRNDRPTRTSGSTPTPTATERGRQSGKGEWTKSRGEDGNK